MAAQAIQYREITKWIATCGVCGGPRSLSGGKVCKGCYSKPEIRKEFLNQHAPQAMPFVSLRSEIIQVEIKPRVVKPRKPRGAAAFWQGGVVAVNNYWKPEYPNPFDALYAKENLWRPGQYETPRFRAARGPYKARTPKLARERYIPLTYPFVAKPRDDNADLLAVNSIVPQGIPGREDVCQEIMLALWEKKITIEQLRASRDDVRAFVRNFNKTNYESHGYAISLDEPRRDGRSWHDVLTDFEAVGDPSHNPTSTA